MKTELTQFHLYDLSEVGECIATESRMISIRNDSGIGSEREVIMLGYKILLTPKNKSKRIHCAEKCLWVSILLYT